jgi:hypothetical protein
VTPADHAWRRLNARGAARIHRGDDGPLVLWWPRGQFGNPFVQRVIGGETLEDALVCAEENTRPPSMTIEDLAWRRQCERQRAARELAEVVPDDGFAR